MASAGGGALRRSGLAWDVASRAVRTLSNSRRASRSGSWRASERLSGIELDGPQQQRNGLLDLIAQREHRREHIEGVVVLGRFGAGGAQVLERLVVVAGVHRQRRGEDTFFGRRGRRGPRRHVALADVQVEAHPLVQLPFLGIARQHRSQQRRCARKLVRLKRGDPLFVERDRFERVRRGEWGAATAWCAPWDSRPRWTMRESWETDASAGFDRPERELARCCFAIEVRPERALR